LKQGSMMVSKYVTHFTQLFRYTPNDVDTDEKKQECFLNGLDDGLAYALEACDFENFQTMVDEALVLENRRGIFTHMCKQECQTQQNMNPKTHNSPSPGRPTFSLLDLVLQQMPQPASQGFVTPQRQMIPCCNPFQTPNTVNQSVQRTITTLNAMPAKANTTCFIYR
jgi:hypothetical protein